MKHPERDRHRPKRHPPLNHTASPPGRSSTQFGDLARHGACPQLRILTPRSLSHGHGMTKFADAS